MASVNEIVERDTVADDEQHLAPDEVEALASEQPDAEPDEQPAFEPPSDVQLERIGKALDKESDRHRAAVARIMGDQMADLAPCPLCVTDGFVMGQAPPDFDPDRRMAVLTAMGEPAAPKLNQHPDLYTCELCGGEGDLLTGSHRDTARTVGCPPCGGKGYRSEAEDQAQRVAASVMPPQPAGAYHEVPGGSPDPWGRPAGHPQWGVPPAEVGWTA